MLQNDPDLDSSEEDNEDSAPCAFQGLDLQVKGQVCIYIQFIGHL